MWIKAKIPRINLKRKKREKAIEVIITVEKNLVFLFIKRKNTYKFMYNIKHNSSMCEVRGQY